MPADGKPIDAMLTAMKASAAVLRDSGIPFALGGGFAAWARGGPVSFHDVDLVIRAGDTDAALAALEAAGMRTERPPEGWLVKAWHDEVLVDLIHSPSGYEEDEDLLDRAEEITVDGMPMPVLPITDVLVSKLRSLNERRLDFEGLLQITRALREQVDWERLRRRTSDSPFARAFLFLVKELGILGP
jgi:predicted nucleotidyltransferase